jgi:hypothetical protein
VADHERKGQEKKTVEPTAENMGHVSLSALSHMHIAHVIIITLDMIKNL